MTSKTFRVVIISFGLIGLVLGVLGAIHTKFVLIAPAIWIASMILGIFAAWVWNFLDNSLGNIRVGRHTKPGCPKCIKSGLSYGVEGTYSFIEKWGFDPMNISADYERQFIGPIHCACSNGHRFDFNLVTWKSTPTD